MAGHSVRARCCRSTINFVVWCPSFLVRPRRMALEGRARRARSSSARRFAHAHASAAQRARPGHGTTRRWRRCTSTRRELRSRVRDRAREPREISLIIVALRWTSADGGKRAQRLSSGQRTGLRTERKTERAITPCPLESPCEIRVQFPSCVGTFKVKRNTPMKPGTDSQFSQRIDHLGKT